MAILMVRIFQEASLLLIEYISSVHVVSLTPEVLHAPSGAIDPEIQESRSKTLVCQPPGRQHQRHAMPCDVKPI